MKKTSVVVKQKDDLEIEVLINNTAYIKSVTGKTGLLNIKNNQIIGKMDNYYTIYDTSGEFYYQEKTLEKASKENRWKSRKTANIYDAKIEKMLVEGWEVVKTFSDYYQLTAFKSPKDGKFHLFDRYACRKDTNIFDMALDDVEFFYKQYNDTYLLLTINDKKGIYRHNCYDKTPSIITPIEFDDIEKHKNIIIYTKNNQKYFVYDGDDGKRSLEFDEITLDEKYKHIVYCRKGKMMYVYNTNLQELLLNEECDDIRYLCFKGENDYNQYYGNFYFVITQNNLKGLVEAEIIRSNREKNISKNLLITSDYDDIEYGHGVFYVIKDGKIGLFKQCYSQNIFVKPNYDKIESLGHNMYAFYYNDRCDVYKIVNSLNILIKNCKLISKHESRYIFEQKSLYGILYQGLNRGNHVKQDVIVDNYDNVGYFGNGYYEVEKNGKKGVNFRSQDIIPMEYDTIDMKFYNKKNNHEIVYFALEKKDLGFELAKKRHWEYSDSDVEFMNSQKFEEINLFEDFMTLKTKTNLLIYDYEEKLLKKFPCSSQISVIYKAPDSSCNKKPIYVIDGKFYFHKEGQFEEVFVEENDLYISTYETETDSFEVRTYNKDEHDLFCSVIDSKQDDDAERYLKEMTNKGLSRNEYRTLVLKRVRK